MPASKRREKERRRARQQADDRRAERRREEEAELAAVVEQIRAQADVIFSPEHSVEEAVDQLVELFAGESRHLDTPLGELVAIRSGAERARALADAALARDPEGVVELQLAAQVARFVEEDAAKAAGCYERALTHAGDGARPTLTRELADAYLAGARLADGLDVLEPLCAADPLDDEAQHVYATLLEAAWARRSEGGEEAGAPCPCGSGDAYGECCRPRERAAVARFQDRSPFDELREALHAYVRDSGLGGHLERELEEWVADSRLDQLPLRGPERDRHLSLLGRLSGEHALLLRPDEPPDGPATGEDPAAEQAWSVLGRFAADEATPPEQARRALDWLRACRYGVWRVADPVPAPGVRVVDVVSARRAYVAFAPEQLDGIARWSVLVGALVPVDGTWRAGGAFVAAGPTEGDELAEHAHWTAEMVGETLAAEASRGRRRRSAEPWRRPPKRPAVPRGVAVDYAEPAPPAGADLYSKVVGRTLPSLCGLVAARRLAGSRLADTHGEPLVTAGVAVPDTRARAETWLDEELPALGGRTPRDAAGDAEGRLRLEGVLRQLEFDADVARQAGDVPADVAWVRQQLDLPSVGALA